MPTQLTRLLSSYMTLSKVLTFSVPQFPRPCSGEDGVGDYRVIQLVWLCSREYYWTSWQDLLMTALSYFS